MKQRFYDLKKIWAVMLVFILCITSFSWNPTTTMAGGYPQLNIGNVSISGTIGTALSESPAVTVNVDLSDGIHFNQNLSQDMVVSDWVTNLPAGLSATLAGDVTTSDTSFTIQLHGTPSVTSSAPIAVTVSAAYISNLFDLSSAENANAVFAIVAAAPSATISDVTVTGQTNAEITQAAGVTATIQLANTTANAFTATDVSSWFTNLPAGLHVVTTADVSAGATTIPVLIYGTPTGTSTEAMSVTIPSANVASGSNLAVTGNTNAKYNITAPEVLGGVSVGLTAGENKVTLEAQTAETGYAFYYKTTAADDSTNKPAVNTTDLTGWTTYNANADIAGTNGVAMYVQVVKVETATNKIKAWGQSNATPVHVSNIPVTDITLTNNLYATNVSIGDSNVYKVFRFQTPAGTAANYTIRTEYIDGAGYDSYGFLCTPAQYESMCNAIQAAGQTVYNGESIAFNDDGGSGLNFYISHLLQANTTYYYIVTRFSTGNGDGTFQLKFSKDIQLELNNQSADIASGTTTLYAKGNLWALDVARDTVTNRITKPQKAGYTFGGYYTQENGEGTQIINEDGTILNAINSVPEGSVLHAKWTALSYTVTVNDGNGSGTYAYGSTVNVTAEKTKDGLVFQEWNVVKGDITFADSKSTTTSFVMPNQEVEISAIYVNKSAGSLTKEVKVTGAGVTASIRNSESDLENKLLTDEEKAKVNNGEDVKIDLTIQDATNGLSKTDQELIRQALGGYHAGKYMDISLFKKVGANDQKQITQTNGTISIVMKVPSDLLNTNSGINRTYKMMRLHDGAISILDGTFNAETSEFVFETDKFSSYTLIYNDVPLTTATATPTQEPVKDDVPKTGDRSFSVVWLFVLALFSGSASVYFKRKTKRMNKNQI